MQAQTAPRPRSAAPVRVRGGALIYVVVIYTSLVGIASLAVDLARVQVAKSQLDAAAVAAARYAVTGLSDSTAVAKAKSAALANYADGTAVVLQTSDVQIGVWNTVTHTFTATAVNPNAVQISAQRTKARGTAIPTLFAQLLGVRTCDVHATAIATITLASSTVINVPGGADPWLAGMPAGTTANFTNLGWTDTAANNAPIKATGINLTAGANLNFNFSGSVSYFPGTQPFNPDGDPSWIINNYYAGQNGNAEHGMADLHAPLTSVIGVFLDASQPDSSAAPAALDFSTAASRDFASLAPKLKQPFFIGDGVRADGVTLQNFVVPTGATRLYIGVMDGQQWSDNSGSLATTVVQPTVITTVR